MGILELEKRMESWLSSTYSAVLLYLNVTIIAVIFSISIVLYFKGFVLTINNTSSLSEIKLFCASNTGKTWDDIKIAKASISRRLLLLNSGEAVECQLSTDFGETAYVYITGYFTEQEKLTTLDVMRGDKGIHVLMNGSKVSNERLSRSDIIGASK